jgi:hypothetical protein
LFFKGTAKITQFFKSPNADKEKWNIAKKLVYKYDFQRFIFLYAFDIDIRQKLLFLHFILEFQVVRRIIN